MDETIGIKSAYLLFWKKAFHMRGRANRLEFWIPLLINFILSMLLFAIVTIIDALLGYRSEETSLFNDLVTYSSSLIMMPPSIAVTSRRLQDININGWWGLIPNLLLYAYVALIYWQFYYFLDHGEAFNDLIFNLNFIGFIFVIVTYIVFIVLLSLKGQPHENKYGAVRH